MAGKEERREKEVKKIREEVSKKKDQRRREGGDKNEMSFKRRRVDLFSIEAFDMFSQGDDLESCGGASWFFFVENPNDLSDFELETRADVPVVPVVTDVLVSPSFGGG